MIIVVEKMINIIAKQTLGGETYYKVVQVNGIDKIVTYFKGLRITGFEFEIRQKLQATHFLEGVKGNALCFIVSDDWKGMEALPEQKGTWIHKSLLYPFICMSGKEGIDFMVRKFNSMMDHIVTLEEDNKAMAMKLGMVSGKIQDLKSTVKAYESMEEEVDKEINKLPYISLPQQDNYTLGTINYAMKRANIQWGESGLKGKAATAEWCYSDEMLKQLLKIEVVIKYDTFHYKAVNKYKSYVYSYKSNRQENAIYNKRTNLPVRFIGLTKKGVGKVIKMLSKKKVTEEFEIQYY